MSISGVIYEDKKPDHEDNRRILLTAFNGDFNAQQGKFVIIKEDAVLGGHYHKYGELFFLLSGQATFKLVNINDPSQVMTVILTKYCRLLIPAYIAHAVGVKAGTILVGYTEEPYKSAAENDVQYPIKREY